MYGRGDKLRFIIINVRELNPEKMGIDSEYYKNMLLLFSKISKNMNTVDELIKEIDDTPFDEDMKAMFRRIVKVSDVSAMTDRQREQYDEDLKCYLDWMATIAAEREDGVAEGIEKGIEKGRVEGRKESDAFFLDFLRKEGYSEERISAIMAGRAESSPDVINV